MTLLSLDDAMAHLNIDSDASAYELTATIETAEAAIASQIGALETSSRTVRVSGYSDVLLLPLGRVASLTSVTPVNGTALDSNLLLIDEAAGTISYADGWTRFIAPAYDVTFDVGWDDPPADLLYAIKELVRHLWSSQRGAASRPGSQVQEPSPGYMMPNRVMELLEPYIPLGLG